MCNNAELHSKEKSGRFLHVFLSSSNTWFSFFFFFLLFFLPLSPALEPLGQKGQRQKKEDHPKSTINNTQSRNFFCYNLSLSIIRQKDFLLFSLSKILEVLLQVVINAVATFWKKRAYVVTWGRSFIYKIIKFENP